MFTEKHADDLLRCEWLPKMYNGNAYLAKFLSYPEDGSSVFLITDTKAVWCEVVKSQRFVGRYGLLNEEGFETNGGRGFDMASHSHELVVVSTMHQLRHFIDAEISITSGLQTDHIISIEYQNRRWRWEVDSVGHHLSSSILSKHLIIPLIVTNGFAFNSETPLADQHAIDLQRELDRVSQIAKRNPHLNAVQALKQPALATSLSRVTALINKVEANYLPLVITEYDEMEESVVTPYPHRETVSHMDTSASLGRTLRNSPDDLPQPPSHAPLPEFVKDLTNVDDETMYTGPTKATVEVIDDDSATESSEAPPTKRRKIVDYEAMKSSPQLQRANPSRRSTSSDNSSNDSPGPSAKRGTLAHSGRGDTTRVKQPLKRGGRRL